MIVYKYKGMYYISIENCSRCFPDISLPSTNVIPENILISLGVSKINIEKQKLEGIILNQQSKVRRIRDNLLKKYDKHVLPHYPIEQLELDTIIAYRSYLRDYTKGEYWWEKFPMTLEEWTNYDEGLYE